MITTIWAALLTVRLSFAGPDSEPAKPAASAGPVGGYWAPGERPKPEPPDGYWKIVLGSVLVPLGILGTGAAVGGAVVTSPAHCSDLTDLSTDQCRGLFAFSLVRVAYSSLMLISGSVILGIGLKERRQHRQWQRLRHFGIFPISSPRGLASGVGLRFEGRF